MRNFHSNVDRGHTFLAFCANVAKAIDASLVSSALNNPTIVLFVPIGKESERSLGHIWRPNQTQINLTHSYTKMGPLYSCILRLPYFH